MSQSSPTRQEEIIEEYEALWNGDISKIDVIAESASLYDPAAPEGAVHGRDAVEAHLRETFRGFPDFTLETHDLLVRDEVVMFDWTASGTFEGEFNGVPPTGRSFTISGMAKTTVGDERVKEDRLYYNESEMLAQLGMTFPDVVLLLPKIVGGKLRRVVE
jgi:steroid delta-isomerase-like uncharacterized protein